MLVCCLSQKGKESHNESALSYTLYAANSLNCLEMCIVEYTFCCYCKINVYYAKLQKVFNQRLSYDTYINKH